MQSCQITTMEIPQNLKNPTFRHEKEFYFDLEPTSSSRSKRAPLGQHSGSIVGQSLLIGNFTRPFLLVGNHYITTCPAGDRPWTLSLVSNVVTIPKLLAFAQIETPDQLLLPDHYPGTFLLGSCFSPNQHGRDIRIVCISLIFGRNQILMIGDFCMTRNIIRRHPQMSYYSSMSTEQK